jgi:hypothetical protein
VPSAPVPGTTADDGLPDCEGLAPAMFLFSISGNTTYALSIIAASAEPKHLITNASWLAGKFFAFLYMNHLDKLCSDVRMIAWGSAEYN